MCICTYIYIYIYIYRERERFMMCYVYCVRQELQQFAAFGRNAASFSLASLAPRVGQVAPWNIVTIMIFHMA